MRRLFVELFLEKMRQAPKLSKIDERELKKLVMKQLSEGILRFSLNSHFLRKVTPRRPFGHRFIFCSIKFYVFARIMTLTK